MAVTASTRLGLTRWSAGTDPFTRAQTDGDHATLDDLVAISLQGTLATRPAASVRGRIHYATDNAAAPFTYDTGTAWVTISTPLTYGSPTASAVGDTAADGAATTVARSDHRHAREAFGAVVAQTNFGAASTNGTASTVARSDHTHGTPATPTAGAVGAVANGGGAVNITVGTLAARPVAGAAGRFYLETTNYRWSYDTGSAWQDINPFGTATTALSIGAAGVVGTANTIARSDHTHSLPGSAAPTASAVGDTQATGSAATVALSDHRHAREGFGAVVAVTSYGQAATNGTATTVARSDHSHGSPALTGVAPSTQAVGDTALVGTGTAPAREDHRHAMPTFGSPVALSGSTGADGTSTQVARADHKHALPASAAPPIIVPFHIGGQVPVAISKPKWVATRTVRFTVGRYYSEAGTLTPAIYVNGTNIFTGPSIGAGPIGGSLAFDFTVNAGDRLQIGATAADASAAEFSLTIEGS